MGVLDVDGACHCGAVVWDVPEDSFGVAADVCVSGEGDVAVDEEDGGADEGDVLGLDALERYPGWREDVGDADGGVGDLECRGGFSLLLMVRWRVRGIQRW